MNRTINWRGTRILITKYGKNGWSADLRGVTFLFWKKKGQLPWKARRVTDPKWVVLWADATLLFCLGTCYDDFA